MADVRLIDANKLARWLKTNLANANPLHCDIRETYSECITMVNCMETIDAAPVVHAEFKETGYDEVWASWGDCKNCGHSNLIGSKYCNECGATLELTT